MARYASLSSMFSMNRRDEHRRVQDLGVDAVAVLLVEALGAVAGSRRRACRRRSQYDPPSTFSGRPAATFWPLWIIGMPSTTHPSPPVRSLTSRGARSRCSSGNVGEPRRRAAPRGGRRPRRPGSGVAMACSSASGPGPRPAERADLERPGLVPQSGLDVEAAAGARVEVHPGDHRRPLGRAAFLDEHGQPSVQWAGASASGAPLRRRYATAPRWTTPGYSGMSVPSAGPDAAAASASVTGRVPARSRTRAGSRRIAARRSSVAGASTTPSRDDDAVDARRVDVVEPPVGDVSTYRLGSRSRGSPKPPPLAQPHLEARRRAPTIDPGRVHVDLLHRAVGAVDQELVARPGRAPGDAFERAASAACRTSCRASGRCRGARTSSGCRRRPGGHRLRRRPGRARFSRNSSGYHDSRISMSMNDALDARARRGCARGRGRRGRRRPSRRPSCRRGPCTRPAVPSGPTTPTPGCPSAGLEPGARRGTAGRARRATPPSASFTQ